MTARLTLSYDSSKGTDGTGAQLQRIFGVYAISKLFRVGYLHSNIKNLIIHSLDPFQSDEELVSYLSRLNSEFSLPSSPNLPEKFEVVHEIIRLRMFSFFRYLLTAVLLRRNTLLLIQNPYAVVEKFPDSYLQVQNYFESKIPKINTMSENDKSKSIVLHIRRGSNGADLLPGELAPRMLPNEYYLTLLQSIVTDHCSDADVIDLLIITDVPKEDFTYRPIESQTTLWSTEPRIGNGVVAISGEAFSEFGHSALSKFNVIHGGDPILAMQRMRSADFLVMSRSSFSYIGAILNPKGTIFYPPAFWHRPMSNWIKVV